MFRYAPVALGGSTEPQPGSDSALTQPGLTQGSADSAAPQLPAAAKGADAREAAVGGTAASIAPLAAAVASGQSEAEGKVGPACVGEGELRDSEGESMESGRGGAEPFDLGWCV